MIADEKDPALAALRAQAGPGVAEWLGYCEKSLWPVAERVGKQVGLLPIEQRELAQRMVRATLQQLAAAVKRVRMRDMARRG